MRQFFFQTISKLFLIDYLLTLPINTIGLVHEVWVYPRVFACPKAQKLVIRTLELACWSERIPLLSGLVTHL